MIRLRNLAVGLVSRAPARVQTKLLVAFLAMVALIILLGAVGLQVLSGMNARTRVRSTGSTFELVSITMK